jgi:citrate synthase
MEAETDRREPLNLPLDLIGQAAFTEALYLRLMGTMPGPGVGRMLDACLVTFLEHGMTPSALAARLTLFGAPESVQGAIAAGILGAGSRYLGAAEDVATMLTSARARTTESPLSPSTVARLALEQYGRVPGLGHPIYGLGDPRATALLALQRELGLPHENSDVMAALPATLNREFGTELSLNAIGAIGAIICDLEMPAECGRGLAVIARCGGLLGHILEERDEPISSDVWAEVRRQFGDGGAAWSGVDASQLDLSGGDPPAARDAGD